jgi:hypothetical protein
MRRAFQRWFGEDEGGRMFKALDYARNRIVHGAGLPKPSASFASVTTGAISLPALSS